MLYKNPNRKIVQPTDKEKSLKPNMDKEKSLTPDKEKLLNPTRKGREKPDRTSLQTRQGNVVTTKYTDKEKS